MVATCKHPPTRLYTWTVNGTVIVCCCQCGKVLKGGVTL